MFHIENDLVFFLLVLILGSYLGFIGFWIHFHIETELENPWSRTLVQGSCGVLDCKWKERGWMDKLKESVFLRKWDGWNQLYLSKVFE